VEEGRHILRPDRAAIGAAGKVAQNLAGAGFFLRGGGGVTGKDAVAAGRVLRAGDAGGTGNVDFHHIAGKFCWA
jgi:hypothetical protein